MRIGTFYSGTIEELNGQSIKTKFFILGIPLFPINSFYFVSKNHGIELPLIGLSAWLGLGRTLCLIFGLSLTILSLSLDHWPSNFIKLLSFAGAIVFSIIAIYSWLSRQTIPEYEKKVRIILEKNIGYNMLPAKLPKEARIIIMKTIISNFLLKYKVSELEEVFDKHVFDKSEIPFLFCLATYIESVNSKKTTARFLARYPLDTL